MSTDATDATDATDTTDATVSEKPEPEAYTLLFKLSKDQRKAAEKMGKEQARALVDMYYSQQENRKRGSNQAAALQKSDDPADLVTWMCKLDTFSENQIRGMLDAYSAAQPLGVWARDQWGIGPVIAAGLLAHIDLEKAPTAGHVWRFAGLDPTSTWKKGEKRPWNASLKTLCWKIGESFCKVSGKEDAFYGQVYLKRKEYETKKNEAGEYAEQAKAGAERVHKSTEAYKSYIKGILPPGHIHSRAKRYAVKLFLAHYHEMGRKMLGLPVPLPYPVAHLGHAHVIEPVS